MKKDHVSLALFVLLTLNSLLSWSQRNEVLPAQELVDAIFLAYGQPICSDEINHVEELIGLEENYFFDKLTRLQKNEGNFCMDPGYKNYDIFHDNPENEIGITVQNIGECTFFLNNIYIKEKWYKGTKDNLIPQLIEAYNIPGVIERKDKKVKRIYEKILVTASNGKSYDLRLTYDNIGEMSWENARQILGLTKIPKNTSILCKIEIRPSDEVKVKMRNMELDLNGCKDSLELATGMSEEMLEELRSIFQKTDPEEFQVHNLPIQFEDWKELAIAMLNFDSTRTLIIADELTSKGYWLDSKANRAIFCSNDELSWIGDYLQFEKNTKNHWDGFRYYYGAPIGLGMVRRSYERKLKGYYFLGMPHGIMYQFKMKNDSVPVMYHFGKRCEERVTVSKDGLQVRYYLVDGDTLYSGLVEEIYPDGVIAQSIYNEGKRQEVLNVAYPDGSVFQGSFNTALQPDGYGEWYFNDPAKHKGFSLVRGTFKNGKPIKDSLYLVNFRNNEYFVETTIDENLLPHTKEGEWGEAWSFKRDEKTIDRVFYVHGEPTFAKLYKVFMSGIPSDMERKGYEGQVDSLLRPHGEGVYTVDELLLNYNHWRGTFEHGEFKEGKWDEELGVLAKRERARRERAKNGTDEAQAIQGYLNANFPSSKYNVSLISSGSEAVVGIQNQSGDFRIAIFDRNNKSDGVEARIKSITRGSKTVSNQEQGLGGIYSFASSSNVKVIFMTPNDSLLSSTIMRGGADSITISLTPTSSGSYLYVYRITPK